MEKTLPIDLCHFQLISRGFICLTFEDSFMVTWFCHLISVYVYRLNIHNIVEMVALKLILVFYYAFAYVNFECLQVTFYISTTVWYNQHF